MSPSGRRSRTATNSALERLRRRLATQQASEEHTIFASIAHQVATRRQEWDLSQQELADLCGTTQSAIARIERGARPPRIDTLFRIATALDCDLVIELRQRTLASSNGPRTDERRD